MKPNNTNFNIYIILLFLLFGVSLSSQTHFPADPYHLIQLEKNQFDKQIPMQTNLFRPIFYNSDTSSFSISFKSEVYFNNNAPNQENMDVRYFSKGLGSFQSIQFVFNNPYLTFMLEPYRLNNSFYPVNNVNRGDGPFSVLNDRELNSQNRPVGVGLRNFLAFFHYKGLGFGLHAGNRWWGPGIHNSLQMTNNTVPIPAAIIGTLKEIKIGNLGLYGIYSFSKMNNKEGYRAKYFTSFIGQVSWYGPVNITLGVSRNFLSGGILSNGYKWTKSDAQKIIFEKIFISNLVNSEYTVGGHDSWDQTLSGYLVLTMPNRGMKLYAELGFNDNRMYFADFLSQPDHSLATVFGVRDYGVGNNNNWLWGFEWTNLMITYTSRHRVTGPGTWFLSEIYNHSTYNGRRWGPHSGTDSDDWYLYIGYLSEKLMIIPGLNYERHGVVTYRPAEVKLEYRLDIRYKYLEAWFGLYYEKQFEAFLGFPDYFYVDMLGNPTGYSDRSKLANTRSTNTLILSINKIINF